MKMLPLARYMLPFSKRITAFSNVAQSLVRFEDAAKYQTSYSIGAARYKSLSREEQYIHIFNRRSRFFRHQVP